MPPAADPALAAHRPRVVLRTVPEDFLVEELPAYPPSGAGEHVFVTFTKRGLTTDEAVRCLAAAAGADVRGAGHAGLKDKHAVTTQTISLPVSVRRPLEEVEAALRTTTPERGGLEVHAVARHEAKLRPGHLHGNRFVLRLRGLPPGEAAPLAEVLRGLGTTGVPNAFGVQRFGHDGENPSRTLAWLRGETKGPRDRNLQRLLFSALQAWLFNRVLARRVEAGTWNRIVPGDVAKRTDRGSLFDVPLEGEELAEARARAEAGLVVPTGPIFGASMRWPHGEAEALEREVLAAELPDPTRLDAFARLGEGTRRPLALSIRELHAEPVPPDDRSTPATEDVVVRFVLPKGGYATTVLDAVAVVTDASRRGPPATTVDETVPLVEAPADETA